MRHLNSSLLHSIIVVLLTGSVFPMVWATAATQDFDKQVLTKFPGLASGDPSDREEAAKAITSQLSAAKAVPVLINLLHDDDYGVRQVAIDSLGNFGSDAQPALTQLFEAAHDQDVRIRKASIVAIGEIQINDVVSLKTLRDAVLDHDISVRLAAIDALYTTYADDSIKADALALALSDSEDEIKISAAKRISQLKTWVPVPVKTLREMLSAGAPPIRKAAANAISQLQANVDDAVVELSAAMRDSNADVRYAAVVALRNVSPGLPSALDVAQRAIGDPSPRVQKAALETLAIIGSGAPLYAKFFVAALKSRTNMVRQAAASAASKLKYSNAELVTSLSEALADDDPDLRYCAVEALGLVATEKLLKAQSPTLDPGETQLRSEARDLALKRLMHNLSDGDSDVRAASATAFANIWEADKHWSDDLPALKIISAIVNQLSDSQAQVGLNALKSLVTLFKKTDTDPGADSDLSSSEITNLIIPRLTQLMTSHDSRTRSYAAKLAGELSDGDVLKALTSRLEDSDFDVEVAAISSLGSYNINIENLRFLGHIATPTLLDFVSSEDGIKALRHVPDIGTAVSSLEKQVKSSEPLIRSAATISLGKMVLQANHLLVVVQDGDFADDQELQRLSASSIPILATVVNSGYAALSAVLSDSDSSVRTSGLEALNSIGMISEEAATKLTSLMIDSDPVVRKEALRAIAERHDAGSTFANAVVQRIVADTDGEVRAAAVDTVCEIGAAPEMVALTLSKAVEDPADKVREHAIKSLQKLGREEELRRCTGSSAASTRSRCVEALRAGDFTPAVKLEALSKLSRDEDRDIRSTAVAGLAELGVAAVPHLLLVMKDPYYLNRCLAIRGLEAAGDRDIRVVASLTSIIESDSNDVVRMFAVEALGKLGETSRLTKYLNADNASVRKAAIDSLGAVQPISADILESLRPRLRDEDVEVRHSAIDAFRKAGAPASIAVSDIVSMLQDTDDGNRITAMMTLCNLGTAASTAVPVLKKMLRDSNPDVQIEAIESLGWIGAAASPAVPDLTNDLVDERTRSEAQTALIRIGPAAIPALKVLTSNPLLTKFVQEVLQAIDDAQKQRKMLIKLDDGSSNELTLDSHTIVIAMGTWCQYSRTLREFLLKPEVQPYLKEYHLIFLFEDEWQKTKKTLVEENKWNTDKEKELLDEKHRLHNLPVRFPWFLEGLTGKIYNVAELKPAMGVPQYPALLLVETLRPGEIEQHLTHSNWIGAQEWMQHHIRLPDYLVDQIQSEGSN